MSWLRDRWSRFWKGNAASPVDPGDMLARSYRFMRLAMAMMAFAILLAMLIQRADSTAWEGSISAYYYTAARPIFTGAMVAIGGFLISVKGRTNVEDIALNLAGMMAPLVPLIPPHQASPATGSVVADVGFPIDDSQRHALLVNNLLVVAIVAAISLGLVWLIGKLKKGAVSLQRHDKIGLAVAASVTVLAVVLYATVDVVTRNAHGIAAAMMFVFLWPAVVANCYSAPQQKYRRIYAGVATAMPVLALAALIAGWIADWRHQVLYIELFELTPFLVYWVAQTFEHWNVGVVTPATVGSA